MPDPAGTYNDGGIKFVRQVIVLKDATDTDTTFIVKEGSLDADVKRITSDNENGVENKQAFMGQIPKGSLTLQFTNAGDKPPKPMQAAQVTDQTGAAVAIVVGKVGQKFGAGEEAMVTVDIFAKQG